MSRQISGTIYKFDGTTPWAGARLVFSLLTDTATGTDAVWPVWAKTVTAGDDGAIPAGTTLDTPPSGSWLYRLKIEENTPLNFYLEQGDGSDLSISEIVTLAGQTGSEAGTPQDELLLALYDAAQDADANEVAEADGSGGVGFNGRRGVSADDAAWVAAGSAGGALGTQLAAVQSASIPRLSGATPGNIPIVSIDGETIEDSGKAPKDIEDNTEIVVANEDVDSFELALTVTGVSAGDYTRVSVNTKGRVTAGTDIGNTGIGASGDIFQNGLWVASSWLGYVSSLAPVHWYKMDESSGAAIDSGGTPKNGTYSNVTLDSAAAPSGIGGNAPLFVPASTSYLNVGAAGLTLPQTTGTIFIAFKMRDSAVWADGTVRHIFNYQRNAFNRVRIYKFGTGELFYNLYIGQNQFYSFTPAADTNWHTIVISYGDADNGDEATCYYDGDLKATLTGFGSYAVGSISPAIVGNDTTTGNSHDGYLCANITWNTRLSPDQIAIISQVGS